jgi:diguanylate cyclase
VSGAIERKRFPVARQHGVEQAETFTRSALVRMAELKIASTPENFAVWYEYFVGTRPDLNKAIDLLLEKRREFTSVLSDELYERFFGATAQDTALRLVSDGLGETVREVQTLVGDAGAEAKTYGRALVNITGEVTRDAASPERLQGVVRRLLIETQTAIERNAVLEQNLKSSAEQIDKLKRSLDDVQREANTDPLTGLANRKAFDENLLRAAADAMETDAALCLLIADIDNFKQFNDSYGHQFGDQVLKLVARCLREGTKEGDLVARYGGEEFAVLLPGCGLGNAVQVAERLRQTIATRRLVRRSTGEEVGAVTISVGTARFESGEAINDLIARADEALYVAKRQGRNRVVSQAALDDGADAG